MTEKYNDPELAKLVRTLAQHINGEIKDADTRFGWTLMVVSLSTGECGFTGNGDRDRMLEMMTKALKKATDKMGPPAQGNA